MWVLIFLIINSNHSEAGIIEFTNQESCEKAAQALRELPTNYKRYFFEANGQCLKK